MALKPVVAIFAFEGCEDIETVTPYDFYLRCGFEPTLFKCSPDASDDIVVTKSGLRIHADQVLETAQTFDVVHMPGGGILPVIFNPQNKKYIQEIVKPCFEHALERDCVVAANCIAPAVLYTWGLFDFTGVEYATCYPGGEMGEDSGNVQLLPWRDGFYTGEAVTVSGRARNVITGSGPAASLEHAAAVATRIFEAGSSVSAAQHLVSRILQEMQV